MPSKTAIPVILLVEDNEDHAILVKKALSGNDLACDIRVVTSGEMAMDYLNNRNEFAGEDAAPRPNLILLDLKLPGMDGIEVLQEIKQDPDLHDIPVIMLTTSVQESDISASYAGGVNSFIQKPIDFNKFFETVKGVGLYWLLTNTPPPGKHFVMH